MKAVDEPGSCPGGLSLPCGLQRANLVSPPGPAALSQAGFSCLALTLELWRPGLHAALKVLAAKAVNSCKTMPWGLCTQIRRESGKSVFRSSILLWVGL